MTVSEKIALSYPCKSDRMVCVYTMKEAERRGGQSQCDLMLRD